MSTKFISLVSLTYDNNISLAFSPIYTDFPHSSGHFAILLDLSQSTHLVHRPLHASFMVALESPVALYSDETLVDFYPST